MAGRRTELSDLRDQQALAATARLRVQGTQHLPSLYADAVAAAAHVQRPLAALRRAKLKTRAVLTASACTSAHNA